MKKLQHLFKHAALLGVCISVAACNDEWGVSVQEQIDLAAS